MNLNEHREILRKNDLEMMKKLDKIIYDAKPRPVPEVKPVIPKTVYMQQELTGTPDYKATKQQANLLLTQQLDSLISSAMSAVSGKTPEKDTKVSQEAQDEYQSMTPIEVGGKQQYIMMFLFHHCQFSFQSHAHHILQTQKTSKLKRKDY